MSTTVIPVVLSGGSGTRLWPESRKQYPKQLLTLHGEGSMLQQTVKRVCQLTELIVVCNEEQRFMVNCQLQKVDCTSVMILEPFSRNTAPAIAVAALQALRQADDPVLVVLPADHDIGDDKAFKSALDSAVRQAEKDKLVAFGIRPMSAETGFGYIKVAGDSGEDGAAIEKFIEKPDKLSAQKYVERGEYFWNSGMFVFKASAYLRELAQYSPKILANCQQSFDQAKVEGGAIKLDVSAFQSCPNDSIDYAIMEHTKNAWLVPLNSSWNDLGSWSTLWEIEEKDENKNVVRGDVLLENCSGNLFHSDSRLIAAIGVEDFVVVDTKDALLIVSKDQVQEVKKMVSRLEELGRTEHLIHREVTRPWGSYDSIDQGNRYQVKHIHVNPGESLSLQMHHHRAEHWIVVSGIALVQRGEEEMLVSENESVYIPIGEKHRLTNPGKLPLELIEVQSGCYLGEDDIVRFSDIYDRVESVV